MTCGDINYIGAISSNNGIRQTINAPFTWEGNCITVNYNGSVGHAYYQPDKFYASDDVNILYAKDFMLDENLALYFCSSIFKASAKYSYSSKWTKERMELSNITLPILSKKIDFDFMRRYIATLKAERVATLKAYLTAAGLSNTILTEGELAALDALRQNRVKWMETPICGENGAFNVNNTHNILKSQVVPDSGNIPYVGAGESNNSVQTYISFDSNYLEKGNSIMIGGKTLVITYQELDYISNDSHNIALYYKDEKKLTRNLQLFLVSALYRSLKPKYHWGDSISKAKIKNDSLMLPVNTLGEVDYSIIQNYISAQIKLSIKDILSSKDLEIKATEDVIADSDYSQFESDESHKLMLAAEPFEIYNWKKVTDTDPKETVLIGCYRDKKHLEWIKSHLLYNIRLGKRKGTADFYHQCFANAKVLYLYDANQSDNYIVYKIESHQEMSGAELIDLDYPRKSPGKSYMTFRLVELQTKIDKSLNITGILSKLDNHTKGTPIFIESDHENI